MNNYGAETRAKINASAGLFFSGSAYGRWVFANLLRLITGRPPSGYERDFIQEVRVTRRAPRPARAARRLLLGWVLIALKCWAVFWAVGRYHVPVNPLWVTVPTVIFAGVCTAIFYWGE